MTEIPSTSPSKTRTTAALSLIAAFIGGAFVGVAGDRFYLFHRHRLFPSARAAQFATRRIVDHLDRDLHFTPQQKDQVQRIIDKHHASIDTIMNGIQPQVRRELDAANAEISSILTPQQRAQFEKIRMRAPGGLHHRGFGPPGRF